MRILETDNWSLVLPPEWRAEQDDEGVLISDRDGVGCLEITALVAASGAVAAADVHAMAGDSPPLQQLTLAGHRAWYREVDEQDTALREWYVGAGAVLLYVTYSCAAEHRGLDAAAVDEILDTLRVSAVS